MDSAVRARLDKHIISAQATLYRSIVGGSFELMPDWARGFSGLSVPTFNIFLPRKPGGLTDDTLADTAAFFSSRDAIYSIELVHDKIPRGPDFLYRRRYQALPPEPAMVLTNLPAHIQLPEQSAISVEPVATVPAVTAFCILQNSVFDFSLQDLRRRFPVSHLKQDKIRHYLAFLNDEPVGAGTLVWSDGVASIWNFGVSDQFRRQGVATCLLQQMLRDAVQKQCDMATVYSSAQAYNFFNAFGFEIFTQRQWFLPQNIEYEVDET